MSPNKRSCGSMGISLRSLARSSISMSAVLPSCNPPKYIRRPSKSAINKTFHTRADRFDFNTRKVPFTLVSLFSLACFASSAMDFECVAASVFVFCGDMSAVNGCTIQYSDYNPARQTQDTVVWGQPGRLRMRARSILRCVAPVVPVYFIEKQTGCPQHWQAILVKCHMAEARFPGLDMPVSSTYGNSHMHMHTPAHS